MPQTGEDTQSTSGDQTGEPCIKTCATMAKEFKGRAGSFDRIKLNTRIIYGPYGEFNLQGAYQYISNGSVAGKV